MLSTAVAPDQVSSGLQGDPLLLGISSCLLLLGLVLWVPRFHRAYKTGIFDSTTEMIDRRDRPGRFWWRISFWFLCCLISAAFFVSELMIYIS